MLVVDVAIICALPEEAEAVVRLLPEPEEGQLGGYRCVLSSIHRTGGPPSFLRVAVVELSKMGNLPALHATSLVIRHLSPHFIILLGICGGLLLSREDFRLGDIVLSDRIVYYEPAKVVQGTISPRAIRFYSRASPGGSYEPSPLLEAASRHSCRPWESRYRVGSDRPDDHDARIRTKIHQGGVCSGEKVVADAQYMATLERTFSEDQIISVEMESAGVGYACQSSATDFLVVKGVSDSADETKSDEHRGFAAGVAAAFVYSFLAEGELPQPLERDPPRLILADLLRLIPHQRTEVVLPSYPNPRHRHTNLSNYPPNFYETAYDDVYCALRIFAALELTSGDRNIECVFDRDTGVGGAHNVILIGSSVSNDHTRVALEENAAWFRFGSDEHDHAIIDPSGRVAYDMETVARTGGLRSMVADYALISVFRKRERCVVVLAGCRAYGQMLLGDYLTKPSRVDQLFRLVPRGDYQCVLKASITGKDYEFSSVRELKVREPGYPEWSTVPI